MTAREAVAHVPGGTHTLGPGDWYIGQAPAVVETLLGSCVCITLWHRATRLGAACHIVLPQAACEGKAHDPRFAAPALRLMTRGLLRRGADPRHCEAKVFGGGRMFEIAGPDIGQRNVEEVLVLLREAGIAVIASDTGRNGYRRIRFDLDDGSVAMRFDPVQPLPQAASR